MTQPLRRGGRPASPALRVWLLSPYHTGSHQAWAEGYARHSRHQVSILSLAGRFWKWRMQGGAVSLAQHAADRLAHDPPPNVVLATDMVHLAEWVALLRRKLPARVPLVLYMHENQLTYPWRPGEKPDLTYAMINWIAQLTADRVLFNSRYHRESWFAALPRLLKHYPDYSHVDAISAVAARSGVSPVGIEVEDVPPRPFPPAGHVPLILWNQRWEYDKRPDRFFALLYRLQAANVPFRVAVAGENFRNIPAEFEEARTRLAERVAHWGYVPSRRDYQSLLAQADLVISAADHEFFGISVLEAIVAGAFPLLPQRLSYPELIPPSLHAACLYADEEALWQMSLQRLTAPRPAPPSLREHVRSVYGWPAAAATLDDWLAAVCAHDAAQP